MQIYKKEAVIFISVEDMIQFLWSNIECFEYLSHVHQIFLRCQSCMSHIGVLLYSQWPDFHQVI